MRLRYILGGLLLPLALLLGADVAWAGGPDKIKIKTPDGAVLVVFKRNGETIKIEDGDGNLLLKGKPRDAGGRKYKGPYDDARYKVSDKDDGFKIKSEGGSLLWKIKRHERRITIADNNEGVMKDALRQTTGNISKAAELLGISRPSLHALLTKYGIRAQDYKSRNVGEWE